MRFPLFQLVVVVALILLLQAANDKSALGQIFNGLDKLVESTVVIDDIRREILQQVMAHNRLLDCVCLLRLFADPVSYACNGQSRR